MFIAYKFRIYPNAEQRKQFAHHFGCVRWVYNWALENTTKHYETHKKALPRKELQQRLVNLKKDPTYHWLKAVNSQSLLSSLLHLHKAYRAFFRKDAHFPKFKKKNSRQCYACPRQCYACPQHVQLDCTKRLLHLPKIKAIRIRLHRKCEGQLKTVTISKTPSDKYFASLLVESHGEKLPLAPIDRHKTLGIDLGLTHFAINSEGQKVTHPKYLRNSLKKLAQAQKIRARKDYKNKSKNYQKQSRNVARIHEKIANRRHNFIHQYTAKLVRENQTTSFAVENLHVKGMIRNKKLARSIADSGWGMFLQALAYKSEWYGKNLLIIGRFVASSKTCHWCGQKKQRLPLAIRQWKCICGHLHDRDINAAKVIKQQALADALGQRVCVKSSSTVIPVSAGAVAKG